MTEGPEPDDPWGARKPDRPAAPAPLALPQPEAAAPAADSSGAEQDETMTPVQFTGARGEWAGITGRGLALYLPTFGFYRFWLRTEQRRFLWRSTAVGGEVLEYHGTARELLIGFLVAIAVYLPLTIGYTLLGLYAETIQAFASVPFTLLLVLFGYYASFRARRYRLTRTIFRGLRFWMDGSAWRYAFIALGWLVASVLTLGIAWPWMAARLEAIKWRHSHYGDLPGNFDGTGWALIKALFWPAVGLVVGAFVPVVNLILIPLMIAALLVVYSRWLISGVSFGPVRLFCDAGIKPILMPALVATLVAGLFVAIWASIGYLTLLGILIGVVNQAGLIGGMWELFQMVVVNGVAIALVVGWMVILMLGLSFIKAVLFDFPRYRLLAGTTILSNVEALETVTQKGQAEGAFGEGLADALGSDGF